MDSRPGEHSTGTLAQLNILEAAKCALKVSVNQHSTKEDKVISIVRNSNLIAS